MADDRFAGAFGDSADPDLVTRFNAIEGDKALDWLTSEDNAPSGSPPGGSQPAREPVATEVGGTYIGDAWRMVKASGKVGSAFLGDLGMGIIETPKQIIGGMRDAAQAGIDLMEAGGDWLAGKAADVGLEDPARAEELASERNMPVLPEIGASRSTTAGVIRKISQFLTGFAVGGKVLGPLKQVGTTVRSLIQGGIADFIAFDEHEARLSDLIQDVPFLKNPVTEYLASDEDDGVIEGRLKNALEGAGLGIATEGLLKGLRVMRSGRAARRATVEGQADAGVAAARAASDDVVLRDAAEFKLLGPESGPAMTRRDAAAAKLTAAEKQTELFVPEDVAAKALTDKGLTRVGDGSVYVNFARIDSPDAIKRVIRDASTAFKDDITEATRGVRKNVDTAKAALEVDAWDTLMARQVGQTLNAEQSVAARELWISAGTKLKEVAEVAAATPSAENLFQFRKMLATFHAVQKEVIGARAETARALQSWKMPAGTGRTRLAGIEAVLNNFGGTEASAELAKAVVAADKVGGLGALSKFADMSVYAKTRDSIQQWWINAILSGPKTHLVNMMSNTSVIGVRMAEQSVASRMGQILGGDDVVEVGEALAQWHGMKNGFTDALENASKSFRTQTTGFGINKIEAAPTRAISSTAWNLRSDSFAGRAVDGIGAIVSLPGRALQAEDEFFKTIGYRMSLHQQAFRQATQEVKNGILDPSAVKARMADIVANPPEALHLEAAYQAAYQTFTNEPGRFVKKLNALRHEFPALRFVIPFVQTPANIFKFTAERTPLAPLTAKYRSAIAKGGAEADLAMTKMTMGTMTTLLAIDLALDGRVTGSGPSNTAERQNLMRQGWRPYSIRMGDEYVAFNRLDPLGTLLSFGGDLGEYLANNDDFEGADSVELERAISATIFAVAENITNKTYLQGFADTVEAINSPDQYAASYMKRFATSLFIPTGVREIAKYSDPVAREAAGTIDEIKSRLPGYSEDVPARRDLWGREMRYQSGLGGLYDALSPMYGSEYKPEAVDRAMAEDGYFIGMPQKSFTIDGTRVSLAGKPRIYSRFLELQGSTPASTLGGKAATLYGGKTMLETLNETTAGQGPLGADYLAAKTAGDREDLVRSVVRVYRAAAKDALFAEFPEIEARARENAGKIRRLPPMPGEE